MRAVAHSPKFAKQVGVKQSVGKDFEMADKKMKKFGSGGMAKKPTPPQPTPAEKAEADRQRESLRKAKVTPKEGKVIDSANRSEGGDGMKKGGKIKKYAIGGVTKEMPTSNQMGSMNMAKGGKLKAGAKAKAKMAMAMVKDRMGRAMASRGAEAPMVPAPSPAAPMGAASPMGGMKKGGGIERKGKTKGKMVKMAKGGSIDGIAQRGKTRCAGVHPGAK
jgi:hypothetical protein